MSTSGEEVPTPEWHFGEGVPSHLSVRGIDRIDYTSGRWKARTPASGLDAEEVTALWAGKFDAWRTTGDQTYVVFLARAASAENAAEGILLSFDAQEWEAFIGGVIDREFDLPPQDGGSDT